MQRVLAQCCYRRLQVSNVYATSCGYISSNKFMYQDSRVFRRGHLRIFRCPIAHLRKNDVAS